MYRQIRQECGFYEMQDAEEVDPMLDTEANPLFINNITLADIEFDLNNGEIFTKAASDLEQRDFDFIEKRAHDAISQFRFPDSLSRQFEKALALKFFQQKLLADLPEIPKYLDEKKSRGGLWTPEMHYTRYWKFFGDIGVLYLDMLRKEDRNFVDSLTSWANRNGHNVRDILPPTRSVRTDLYGSLIEGIFGEEGIRIGQAHANRKNRSTVHQDDLPQLKID